TYHSFQFGMSEANDGSADCDGIVRAYCRDGQFLGRCARDEHDPTHGQQAIDRAGAATENPAPNRSTRQLSLTEAGSAYFESSKRILDTVNEAEANLGVLQTQLTGVLRINSSIGLGQMYLGPLVLKFQSLHPGLMIDLAYADRFVDLVEEGIDVAIRIGRLMDSNLVARRLGSSERCIIATPGYLKKNGIPKIPQDLANHNCILYAYLST